MDRKTLNIKDPAGQLLHHLLKLIFRFQYTMHGKYVNRWKRQNVMGLAQCSSFLVKSMDQVATKYLLWYKIGESVYQRIEYKHRKVKRHVRRLKVFLGSAFSAMGLVRFETVAIL